MLCTLINFYSNFILLYVILLLERLCFMNVILAFLLGFIFMGIVSFIIFIPIYFYILKLKFLKSGIDYFKSNTKNNNNINI